MLFNSYEFIFLFLPITFICYFYLTHKRLINGSKIWLVAASLFFYSWWNIYYLPLILSSIFVNFFIGSTLSKINSGDIASLKSTKIPTKKQLLIFGLAFNILLLCFFKYADMFIVGTNSLLGLNVELLNLAVPIGISFFTITQIAYVIDSYEGLVEEYDFLNYMLFVSFFPHLLIGPILHHKDMMPQFASKWNWIKNNKNMAIGIAIFSIGLFKKVIIADYFSIWANNGFNSVEALTFIEAWVISLSYTFQIYFDFSGYTDMAIGIALFFNIKLPVNFNSPYKSTSIIEFWQRWHITLTKFITTYIYSPIIRASQKITFIKSMLAMFTAMLIAGLWHGGSLNYLIFYTIHAFALVANHIWRRTKIKINKVLAWLITFNFINISLVFFRATDLGDAQRVLTGMLGLNGIILPDRLADKFAFLNNFGVKFGVYLEHIDGNGFVPLMVLLVLLHALFFKNSQELIKSVKPTTVIAFYIGLLLAASLLSLNKVNEFIYFNF